MSEHTKGPWLVDARQGQETAIIKRDGGIAIRIATICGSSALAPMPEIAADARLIAAAPDLLAALASVNKLISEAAMTGFNCFDGDWAERLFHSQQATSAALALARSSQVERP